MRPDASGQFLFETRKDYARRVNFDGMMRGHSICDTHREPASIIPPPGERRAKKSMKPILPFARQSPEHIESGIVRGQHDLETLGRDASAIPLRLERGPHDFETLPVYASSSQHIECRKAIRAGAKKRVKPNRTVPRPDTHWRSNANM